MDQADDPACRSREAVSNGTASTVKQTVAPTWTAPTTSREREENAFVTTTSVPQFSATSDGVSGTNLWIPPIVGSIVTVVIIILCVIVLFTYRKRRGTSQNQANCRPGPTSLSQVAHALQSNPMYSGNKHGTLQTEGMQEPSQTNDATYNQIDEDEVYDASGHSYNEIKDEDVSGGDEQVLDTSQTEDNAYNQINEDEVYDPSHHDYSEIKDEAHEDDNERRREDINDTSDEVSQNRNEEHDDSVSFYAAAAEVVLPTDRNTGGHTSLYQSDRKTAAPVDYCVESLPVTRSVDQQLTVYNMDQ
ncbi:Hypp5856 [Branchiostoma lanceolatum]|uniref:Hypp5856 protein n=1 Tax=Branchiostoma lanceolatum TaxID=7740 RepID=A0A8J9YSI5_BRALA|nr:Hypp5856 [Branchiostoma lanceolatum]